MTRPPPQFQDPTYLEVDHAVAAFTITTRRPGSHSAAAVLIVAVGACLLGVIELIKVRAEDAQPHRPSADEASGNWPHHVNVTIGLFVVSALIAGVLYMLSLKEPTAGPTPDSGVPELLTVPAITLADPRAADPCSLLDPKDLARFGQAAIETGVGRFTECNVEIDLPGDAVVDVNAEFLTPLAADQTVPGNVQSLGGLIIGRTPANSTTASAPSCSPTVRRSGSWRRTSNHRPHRSTSATSPRPPCGRLSGSWRSVGCATVHCPRRNR
jgi:hypothetical protein